MRKEACGRTTEVGLAWLIEMPRKKLGIREKRGEGSTTDDFKD